MKLTNINNTPGSIDEFITPSIDLTQFVNPKLTYRISYASLTGTPGVDYQSNAMQVLSSVDCGKTWGIRKSYTEATMSTTADQNAAFTPTAQSQWRLDVVSLALFSTYTNIQFKFRFEAGEGNNIYIDDINIDHTTSLSELEILNDNFRIYPNPADNDAVVYFTTETNAPVSVKVYDVLGKEVYFNNLGELNAGNHNLILNKTLLNSSGVYFVQLTINDQVLSKKFILK
jgi:hypothetical protein